MICVERWKSVCYNNDALRSLRIWLFRVGNRWIRAILEVIVGAALQVDDLVKQYRGMLLLLTSHGICFQAKMTIPLQALK